MNDLLKNEIRKSLIKKPSEDFQSRVMNQIFKLKKVKPLISKRFWIMLSVFSASFILLLFFVVGNVQQTSVLNQWVDFSDIFGRFETLQIDQNMLTTLTISSAVLFSLFLLLLFDRFLNEKRVEE